MTGSDASHTRSNNPAAGGGFARLLLLWGALALLLACSGKRAEPASDHAGAPAGGSGSSGAGSSSPGSGGDGGVGGRTTAGDSGRAGTATGGSGGGGGTRGDTNSAACMPPGLTLTLSQANARTKSCALTENSGGVENPNGANVSDLPLDAPLAAGQTHAVNLSPPSSGTPGIMEIWGASEACVPRELLWFGAMEGRRQCAQFTPTQEHQRLLFIGRKTDVLNGTYFVGTGAVSVCPMGTCGATQDGVGLGPGATLAPPPGVYETGVGQNWWAGSQWEFGVYGQILVTTAQQSGFPKPILAALFRPPAPDPYGDAWHCAGAGSQWAVGRDTSSRYITLAGITRLPSCDASGSGTATMTWDGPKRQGTVTSSASELSGTDLSISGHCAFERCLVRAQTLAQDRSVHLFLHARGDFGPPSGMPNTQQMEIREAIWLSIPKSGTPIAYACTTSGTVRYDPNGTSTVTVQNLSDLAPCGGTPATPASTKLIFE